MIWHIWKKEMAGYFSSPLAYVLIGLFSVVTGIMFFNLLVTYTDGIQAIPQQMAQSISFIDEVVLRLFANINFLFLFFIPLITMRLFTEERKQETLDLYWMAPVGDWQLIVAKGLAAFAMILAMLLMTLLYPLIIWGAGIQDLTVLGSAYLSILLNALAYISLGLFCSSLTANQIVAALLSILGVLFLWLITWGGHLNSNFLIAQIFTYVGISSHFERVLRGLIGTQDLIYYGSFIFLFLFLTQKSLGRRNW